jgi:RNA polymerase-associated protein CTR9
MLARIGAAQCCIGLGQEVEAVGLMTSEGKARYPDSPDGLRIWAYLNAKLIRKDIGRRFHSGRAPAAGIGARISTIESAIDRILKERPDTAEEMALVKAGLALDCVQNESDCASVLSLMTSESMHLNKAVLLMNSGNVSEAKSVLEKITDMKDELVYRYTCALLMEAKGDSAGVESAYRSIISACGEVKSIVWAMCTIRIALMAERRGETYLAELYPIPSEVTDGVDLVLLAKAMAQERQGDLEGAIKTVATVGSLKHDQYTNTFVGNLFLRRAILADSIYDSKEEEKLLDSALKFFQRALESSACAFQASLGVASVLAHKNRKWQSLDLLKSLAEVKGGRPADDAAVQINMGHLIMDEGTADSAKKASKSYEAALRLLGDDSLTCSCRLYLAAAHFASDKFEEALECLDDGASPVIRFDRAVVLENYAAKILMDKAKAQSLDLVRKAIDMLTEAICLFESLSEVPDNLPTGFKQCLKNKLTEHIDYCKTTAPQAENWYTLRAAQLEEDRVRREQLEAARREREEADRARLEEQRAREREEAEQLAAQAEQRMMDIKESLTAAMKNIDEMEKKEEEEGGKNKRRKATARPSKKKRRVSSSSDDDSSSSSSSSSSSGSSSSGSSSSGSSSDSSSSSSSPVARPNQPVVDNTTMEDLFGEEAL